MYAEKIIWQNTTPFMIKILNHLGINAIYFNIVKVIYDKTTTITILNGEKLFIL